VVDNGELPFTSGSAATTGQPMKLSVPAALGPFDTVVVDAENNNDEANASFHTIGTFTSKLVREALVVAFELGRYLFLPVLLVSSAGVPRPYREFLMVGWMVCLACRKMMKTSILHHSFHMAYLRENR
jgi:hypothetical protein